MLGLGLSLARAGGRVWHPFDLDGALIDLFDPRRLDLLTRPVGQQVSSSRWAKSGAEFTQSVSTARPVYDSNCLGGVRNKASSFNISPDGALTNMTLALQPANGLATLTEVDDTAAIEALIAQLLASGRPLTAAAVAAGNRRAFRLDNSAGDGPAVARSNGNTIQAGPHASVVWARGSAGEVSCWKSVGLANSNGGTAGFNASAVYVRSSFVSPNPDGNMGAGVRVAAGAVVTFIALGLYPGLAAPLDDVAVSGAPAWAYGKPGLYFDGNDDQLERAGPFLPGGSTPTELWDLNDNQALPSDVVVRIPFSWGGDTSFARYLSRRSVSGVNRGSATIGNGGGLVSPIDNLVDLSGRHLMRQRVTATEVAISIDGGPETVGSGVPATGTVLARMAAVSNSVAANFWLGALGPKAAINPTHPNWTPQNAARLKAWFDSY